MTEALAAATAAIEGKMSKSLKKVLKKVFASEAHEQLAVADAKLGSAIKVRMVGVKGGQCLVVKADFLSKTVKLT